LFELKWMVIQLVNPNIEWWVGRFIYTTKHYTSVMNRYHDLNHWSGCCSAHECFKCTKHVVNQAPNCWKPFLRESKITILLVLGTGTVVYIMK
jgi:hypothetical protein